MADTIRGKVAEAGNAVAEAATKVGNRIGEKAEEAKDWVKQQSNKVANRADEEAQEAKHEAEEACEDAKAHGGSCHR